MSRDAHLGAFQVRLDTLEGKLGDDIARESRARMADVCDCKELIAADRTSSAQCLDEAQCALGADCTADVDKLQEWVTQQS